MFASVLDLNVRSKFAFVFIAADVGNKTKLALRGLSPRFRNTYSPMLTSTRKLLNGFFRPYNRKLEDILHRRFW